MKLEIWTKSTRKHERPELKNQEIPCVLVFKGEWPTVPRVDEFINPFGWGSGQRVLEVWHNLDEGDVHLYIAPDYTGEFFEEARKRGIEQRFYPAVKP